MVHTNWLMLLGSSGSAMKVFLFHLTGRMLLTNTDSFMKDGSCKLCINGKVELK